MRHSAVESTESSQLEFRQSSGRALLNRLYRATGQAFVIAGGVLVSSSLGLPEQYLVPGLAVAFGLPILASVWLLAFNSGAVRLPSQVVQLRPEGVRVQRFDDLDMVPWEEVTGVSTAGILFRRIVIRVRRGRPLQLDYFSLRPEERRRLFQEIAWQRAALSAGDETAGRLTTR